MTNPLLNPGTSASAYLCSRNTRSSGNLTAALVWQRVAAKRFQDELKSRLDFIQGKRVVGKLITAMRWERSGLIVIEPDGGHYVHIHTDTDQADVAWTLVGKRVTAVIRFGHENELLALEQENA